MPMACTLDVPVRVASDHTLERYTALEGCAPARFIVAPLDRALAVRQPVPIDPPRRPRSSDKRRGRIGDTSVEQTTLGAAGIRVVRIVPTLPTPPAPAPAAVLPLAVPQVPVAPSGEPIAAAYMPTALDDAAVLRLRPAQAASPYDLLIANAATRYRVDPLLLHSVIRQESRYRPHAISRVGAHGLMQIMPGTGMDLGVANPAMLMNPAVNIDVGARLLRRLWGRMGGRFDLVLAAYNSGEGAVRRYGMHVPPYLETRNYVAKVQGIYKGLAATAGMAAAN